MTEEWRTRCILPHRRDPDRPRQATAGHLCRGHYHGLEQKLAEVTAVYDWLGACMVRDGTGVADEQVRGSREAPTPLRVSMHDLRADIAGKLSSWVHLVTEERDLRGPDRFDDPQSSSGWLLSQVDWISGQPWVDDLFGELEDWHRLARAAAPYHRQRRDLPAPCPECDLLALSLYGGDDHVTCRACGHLLLRELYDHYVRVLHDDEMERRRKGDAA